MNVKLIYIAAIAASFPCFIDLKKKQQLPRLVDNQKLMDSTVMRASTYLTDLKRRMNSKQSITDTDTMMLKSFIQKIRRLRKLMAEAVVKKTVTEKNNITPNRKSTDQKNFLSSIIDDFIKLHRLESSRTKHTIAEPLKKKKSLQAESHCENRPLIECQNICFGSTCRELCFRVEEQACTNV